MKLQVAFFLFVAFIAVMISASCSTMQQMTGSSNSRVNDIRQRPSQFRANVYVFECDRDIIKERVVASETIGFSFFTNLCSSGKAELICAPSWTAADGVEVGLAVTQDYPYVSTASTTSNWVADVSGTNIGLVPIPAKDHKTREAILFQLNAQMEKNANKGWIDVCVGMTVMDQMEMHISACNTKNQAEVDLAEPISGEASFRCNIVVQSGEIVHIGGGIYLPNDPEKMMYVFGRFFDE